MLTMLFGCAVTAYGEKGYTAAKADNGVETKNGHTYVDLGLPSGLKWATCNIGADSPEEYGDYYAFGETETKATYSEDNSKWYGVSYKTLKRKKVLNSNGNLTAAHDVAVAKWGGKWRMPTAKEQEELLNECTWEWTAQNGKSGYVITGPNGKSIFLPAAGFRSGSDLKDAGGVGHYWGATAYNGDFNACYMYFHADGHYWFNFRYYGRTIRPVTE